MKALLSAPQTAMRHHSQRGRPQSTAREEKSGFRGTEKEGKARRLKLFYLEGLESAFNSEIVPCRVY